VTKRDYRRPLRSKTSTIDIYIKLAQYPILSDTIRERMREALYERGIISEEEFEREVEEMAVQSQKREGTHDPFYPEPAGLWNERKARIRNFHTDYHFAYNLPPEEFDQLVNEVIVPRHKADNGSPRQLDFNPELAPWEMLFRQGEVYERQVQDGHRDVQHHLEEIKVALIRGMITDQLPLIAVAKKVLGINDLRDINERRIGTGKIGGKAAGMLIAWKILQQNPEQFPPDQLTIPESYYLGTNVMYDFRRRNGLEGVMNQKYKPLDEIRADYPGVVESHLAGEMPQRIVEQLRAVLNNLGRKPVIVRSSSLLEDNFGTSFAGKYESYFCPNQGTPEENLVELVRVIKLVYASTLNPDALLYRRKHGLIDYDERMAILIQEVRGERFGRYHFPALAGVAFSRNPFRWNPVIRRDVGFLRLVCGMGTRAVNRVSTDYPRLIALSHPELRPETTPRAMRQYSQRLIDVIDLEANRFRTLPMEEVLTPAWPGLRYVGSVDSDGFMQEILSAHTVRDIDDVVLTFNRLTRDANFVTLMRDALAHLEATYGTPVDVEFAVDIIPEWPRITYRLCLLQCRPLSERVEGERVTLPPHLAPETVIFSGREMVSNGRAEELRYIVFVDPEKYGQVPDPVTRLEIGRSVGRINKVLEGERFMLMGPGRWGSSNLDLGVRVTYADIHNTRVLMEIAVPSLQAARPELSYGTHFFQDLVEAGIHALPLHLDQGGTRFHWQFLRQSPNVLADLVPEDGWLGEFLRVIDVAAVTDNRYRLNVLMDGEGEQTVGFLAEGKWPPIAPRRESADSPG
jgi:hypothetical protein